LVIGHWSFVIVRIDGRPSPASACFLSATPALPCGQEVGDRIYCPRLCSTRRLPLRGPPDVYLDPPPRLNLARRAPGRRVAGGPGRRPGQAGHAGGAVQGAGQGIPRGSEPILFPFKAV